MKTCCSATLFLQLRKLTPLFSDYRDQDCALSISALFHDLAHAQPFWLHVTPFQCGSDQASISSSQNDNEIPGGSKGRLMLLIHAVPIFYPQASILPLQLKLYLLPSPYSFLTVFQISNMITGSKLVVQENEDSLPSPNTDSYQPRFASLSGCLI